MADLSITASNVAQATGATVDKNYVAGETITAGQALYIKGSDGKLWKAQADGTSEEATVYGIALNGASADQPVAVLTGGNITIGATIAVGTVYVVSATAGGIAPWADLVSTNRVSLLAYGASAGVLTINKVVTGVQIP